MDNEILFYIIANNYIFLQFPLIVSAWTIKNYLEKIILNPNPLVIIGLEKFMLKNYRQFVANYKIAYSNK